MSLQPDLQFALDITRSAGPLALEHFGKIERLTKRGAEAVTAADRAVQRHLVSHLRKRFPNDGIIGEENDTGDAITFECPDPDGRVWVIDPIDGTNNFIAGLGAFAVCLGLMEKGVPVLGVVYDLTRDQMYYAASGLGAFVDDRPIKVSPAPMGDASVLMLTSSLLNPQGQLPAWVTKFLGQTRLKVRIFGTAAIEAILVAAGVAHAAITVNGKIWDIAAAAAVVLEAGGVLVDLQGNDVFPVDLRSYSGGKVPFIAAAPQALGEIVDVVKAG